MTQKGVVFKKGRVFDKNIKQIESDILKICIAPIDFSLGVTYSEIRCRIIL